MSENSIAHLLKAAVDHQVKGNVLAAEELYMRILKRDPLHFEALNNLGIAKTQQLKYEEAIALLKQAFQLRPHSLDAGISLARILTSVGKVKEGIAILKISRLHNAGNIAVLHYLSCSLHQAGFVDEAISIYCDLLAIDPSHMHALNNLALAYGDIGEHEKALFLFQRTLQLYPDFHNARANRALSLLLLGRHQEGWNEYQNRPVLPEFQRYRSSLQTPIWRGEPLNGKKILIIGEQGAGDSIQFFRYLPLIQQKGGDVILYCKPNLMRLFRNTLPDICIANHDLAPPSHDVHMLMMNAPLLFGIEPKDIPSQVPYLTLSRQDLEKWKKRFSSFSGLKIGLAWAGNPNHRKDHFRSIHPALFAPLKEAVDCTFFSLQKMESSSISAYLPVQDFTEDFLDFAETAACITELDLVISVDTSIIHLAGALGKPAWLLLPYSPDWRWMLERTDSPWYPSLRLFRQKKLNDWMPVIEEVKEHLILHSS